MYVAIQEWLDGLVGAELLRETKAHAVTRGHIGTLNRQIVALIKEHNTHVKFYSR